MKASGMDRERFEALVAAAVSGLPGEFLERLENVDVVIQESPSRAQLTRAKVGRGGTLFGLYEGIPLTRRGSSYTFVPPDRITIFKTPIESVCHSDDEIIKSVGDVVKHEIAHHFGISDARLDEIERDRENRSN